MIKNPYPGEFIIFEGKDHNFFICTIYQFSKEEAFWVSLWKIF